MDERSGCPARATLAAGLIKTDLSKSVRLRLDVTFDEEALSGAAPPAHDATGEQVRWHEKRRAGTLRTTMNKIAPSALYQQLGQLAVSVPDLTNDWNTEESRLWLGRTSALVEATGNIADTILFNTAHGALGTSLHQQNVQTIISILHRALARAELAAPATAHGAFLAVGEPFAAFVAVGKILGSATKSTLIVDPYADANLVNEFALLAPEGVPVMILADMESHKPALRPAAAHFAKQYGPTRPLEVRLAPPRSLHDRVIFIDQSEAYILGQSFNALAKRSPTSLVRVDPETAAMKAGTYGSMWASATPLA